MRDLPIGVFDSGVGGLTVLKALQAVLPNESFVYLGDTARLPYGTKSRETVIQYALGASELIFQHHPIKMLVVACNTASTLAYQALCHAHPDLPIMDVVAPGAKAAVALSQRGDIAVIATEATVRAGGYQTAIHQLWPEARVQAESAGVLVALAEEGWVDNEVAIAAVRRYLDPLLAGHTDFQPDCLLLGCTHFPVLFSAIAQVVGNHMPIVDSATATAIAVMESLEHHALLARGQANKTAFLVTDSPARFSRVAARFLGEPLLESHVTLVSL